MPAEADKMCDTKKLRTAVVGLGIGMGHVAGYLASPNAELIAVADAWAPRREFLGGTFNQGSMLNFRPLFEPSMLDRRWEDLGIRVHDDISAVTGDPEIDLVSLCTPDDTHEMYAVELLHAGKNLILEKPVSLSLESARKIATAADVADRRIAVNFEMRINPAVQKLRELVGSGALGEIQAFNLQQYRAPFRRDKWGKWIQHRERSGGLIVEETCHWFDLCRFLTGREFTSVHAVSNDRILDEFDYEDIAFVQGTLAGGAIFQIGHALTGFDFTIIIQLHGTRGTAWCGLKASRTSLLDAGQSDYLGVVSWGPVDAPERAGHVVTFGDGALEAQNIREHVIRCCQALVTDTPFLADLNDGLQSLKISLAARRSAESGTVEQP